MGKLDSLQHRDTVVILATAPAGLGHLRVANALYEGLPHGVSPVLFGTNDPGIQWVHRLMSINPKLRSLMEKTQNGKPQAIFTKIYRYSLRQKSKGLVKEMVELLNERVVLPKTLVVVATHFGLAHQLSVVKKDIEKATGVKMVLVMQVTDDSPQFIWYVPGVDLAFVPSETTKTELERYGKSIGFPKVKFEVNAYPISPVLKEKLTLHDWHRRMHQVDSKRGGSINISLPISGAAVGLDFYRELIKKLHSLSGRFVFHIVSRESAHTEDFLNEMREKSYVRVFASKQDRRVVEMYQEMFQQYVMSLEVTKPSEQAFKALYRTDELGGVVVLLSTPVGRQEYDNLAFLRRHWLLPTKVIQEVIWKIAKMGILGGQEKELWWKRAAFWRAVRIPDDPVAAAEFIDWGLSAGLWHRMMQWRSLPDKFDDHKHELNHDGVGKFWERVAELV
jgi:hypothetical protein